MRLIVHKLQCKYIVYGVIEVDGLSGLEEAINIFRGIPGQAADSATLSRAAARSRRSSAAYYAMCSIRAYTTCLTRLFL